MPCAHKQWSVSHTVTLMLGEGMCLKNKKVIGVDDEKQQVFILRTSIFLKFRNRTRTKAKHTQIRKKTTIMHVQMTGIWFVFLLFLCSVTVTFLTFLILWQSLTAVSVQTDLKFLTHWSDVKVRHRAFIYPNVHVNAVSCGKLKLFIQSRFHYLN